jgi:membrane fusion protein, heavy metal efflux system
MRHSVLQIVSLLAVPAVVAGCSTVHGDPGAEAPPPAHVEHEQDGNMVSVDHPEQFPLFTAAEYKSSVELAVTGTVSPDVSRTVPVISLASGRVLEIQARLGDTVQKGQVLMKVQSTDVSGAFSDYRKAVADELLARKSLERANDLFSHGAIAAADLESAQDGEEDAKVTLEAAVEHLRVLGNDPNHPSAIVDVVAPVSGVITDQQVTTGAGVQSLSSTNPFTISDLSRVWVVCDVYENDLSDIRIGDRADIRLNAYPNKVFKGVINNIGEILDPALRTAKVRIEVNNPGIMRIGMFVTATFNGRTPESHTEVPASAILHLHDRDWVYMPDGDRDFRRVEVVAGDMLQHNLQEVISGIRPGNRVVSNALVLQNTIEQ